ncbi:hypothetical protein HHK36_001686 [Tetracentron sinense]|uniref:Protein kinase domain-containing protein n=1 Tax=Tetracentron sinense TaxID=13715 RepID=A0A834ZU47_TETSI|nr:hypothetical protein HHK36_001686 [Tetracentron sinense]
MRRKFSFTNQEEGRYAPSSAELKSREADQGLNPLITFGHKSIWVVLYQKKRDVKGDEEDYLDEVLGMHTRSSFVDWKAAIDHFSWKLGQGGFGSVLEGTLSNGTKVAVKCLDCFGQLHVAEAMEVMKVAAWCLRSDFTKRLSMSVVEKVLEGLIEEGRRQDMLLLDDMAAEETLQLQRLIHLKLEKLSSLFESLIAANRRQVTGGFQTLAAI